MSDDFGAVEEDVPFDWGGADRLIGQFRSTAAVIEAQRGSRRSAGEHALIDWKGPHADEFRSRQSTCDADAGQIAESLRRSATQVEELRVSAEEEQKRRELAREYLRVKEENDRSESFADKIGVFLTGDSLGLPPAPPPPREAPTMLVSAPAIGGRG